MYKEDKTVTIEWITDKKDQKKDNDIILQKNMTSPINNNLSSSDKLKQLVSNVLANEIPKLKNNSLLYNLVLYTLTEKMKTVQTVENVLSYIKGNNAKEVKDVSFKNGEIHIKCST